jgi:anti-sigma-K factor RskA
VNIQEYISSGIIESYVLGLASSEERREFEELCRQHPELVDARNAFELALEKQAMENAITPPGHLKESVIGQITTGKAQKAPKTAPVRRIYPIKDGWVRYAAVAVILILAGSVYFNLSLYNKNRKLLTENEKSLARLNEIEKEIAVLQGNPNVKMAKMKGMEVAPRSYATVYWDTASHDVYLLANNLPVPPNDMQYQLWALLDGKPIDLGMLDFDIKQQKLLVRMKNAQNAQAFAITLEKKDRPNVSTPSGTMYVMGGL